MFSSVFDIFCPRFGTFFRRHFPFVSLGRNFLDHYGKAIAFVWQVYLLVGPSFLAVRRVLDSIISVTVDMGVERHIGDMPDFLLDFFSAIDPSLVRGNYEEREYLLPFCLVKSGWNHMWDLLLRNALNSMEWWPDFLTDALTSIILVTRFF